MLCSDKAGGYPAGSATDGCCSFRRSHSHENHKAHVFPNSEKSVSGFVAHLNELDLMQFWLMLENKLDCWEFGKICPLQQCKKVLEGMYICIRYSLVCSRSSVA